MDQRRSVGIAIAFVAFVATIQAGPAVADKRRVEFRNETKFPIYRITAWPEDFLPNTFNLTPFPLGPDESRTVEVNDDYDKCVFTLVADFRNPRRKFATLREMRRFPEPEWFRKLNLCGAEARTIRVLPPGSVSGVVN